jgi:peptidoglycan/LPS O-acetylase OafA/YrhL
MIDPDDAAGSFMPKPHARVVELDILRAVAIIIIVISHLSFFLPTVTFSDFTVGMSPARVPLTFFGVALFLFISGFVLYLNHPSFPQRKGLTDFFKKRVLRIFPLYWLAIALVFVLGRPLPDFATRVNTLITVLGLQGFLGPRFVGIMYGWWFVGVILVLYTIYPLIIALASDALNLPAPINSDVIKFVLMLIVPFLILVVAYRALSIIASTVFLFYGIFVFGVAISKYDILGKYGFLTDDRTRLLKYVAVAAVSLIAVLFIYNLPQNPARESVVSHFVTTVFLFIMMNLMFLLFALLAFCLVRILVVSSSKASRPLSQAVWYRTLLLISFSSYAIYLFFTTILIQFMLALMGTNLTALEIDIVQIFVGLPTVVVIAFVLQSTQNGIQNRIKKYRSASSPYRSG